MKTNISFSKSLPFNSKTFSVFVVIEQCSTQLKSNFFQPSLLLCFSVIVQPLNLQSNNSRMLAYTSSAFACKEIFLALEKFSQSTHFHSSAHGTVVFFCFFSSDVPVFVCVFRLNAAMTCKNIQIKYRFISYNSNFRCLPCDAVMSLSSRDAVASGFGVSGCHLVVAPNLQTSD